MRDFGRWHRGMRGWAGLTHGIVVASGNLCTTAYLGGRYDLGVVFEITP